jgi:hypothetical protein
MPLHTDTHAHTCVRLAHWRLAHWRLAHATSPCDLKLLVYKALS